MAKPEKVIRARSWDELPDILEPGEYRIDGVTLRLKEPLEKEDAMELVSLVKRVDKKYYG
ncbi:MAG: hypothetical protein F7C81_04825 [Desulfurococcales archaeon]|nr:hypothetical protein [Desulfurococcales archaeon]